MILRCVEGSFALGKRDGVLAGCFRLFLSSDVLHKLRVEEGEPGKLVLVEVHHEELVGGREVRLLGGELAVKVGDVLAVALQEIQRGRTLGLS